MKHFLINMSLAEQCAVGEQNRYEWNYYGSTGAANCDVARLL